MKLFKNNPNNTESIRQLAQFFNEEYLRKINLDSMLARGEIPDNISSYYDAKELEILKNKKEITFKSSNKCNYKVGDKVELQVSIKNVKRIHIKVYEFSLEKTNLLDQKGSLSDDVNLEFLKPTSEEIYEH